MSESNEINRILREELLDQFCENYITIGEDETVICDQYLKFSEDIKNFEVHNSDVIVASYPKTGTTWVQEMVWMIANNLDYKGAEVDHILRFPFLEMCTLCNWEKLDKTVNSNTPDFIKNSIEYTKRQKSPRFIKTHLPFSLLPDDIKNGSKSPKIIYVTRNPKDVCVSYFHHGQLLQRWQTNLENFSKVFLADKAMYGSFWKHVLGYYKQRNLPNLLIVKYEDMKEDLPAVIRKVAEFLDKELTEEQIHLLTKHLSFESMKKNKAVNAERVIEMKKKQNLIMTDGAFIRAGVVGKYKEELFPETIERFDAWIKKNIDGTDFGKQYNYNL